MYLAHYGIKGQRWGFRRFQNGDGSLTPAGRERYGRSRKQKDLNSDPLYAAAKGVSGKEKNAHGPLNDIRKANNSVRTMEETSSSLEKMAYKYKARRMSDEELRAEIDSMIAKQAETAERRKLERQYTDLKNQEVNTGREAVRDAIDVVGKVITGATAAATLYVLIRDAANR